MMDLIEVNFDGLVGPTHHYGGWGVGNLASIGHRGLVSHPRRAAIEGIEKMRLVVRECDPARVGQAVLPPQNRPRIDWLRELGFLGDDADVLQHAADQAPELLSAAYSASAMWTANAACVSPATDCSDAKTHLTVSNLSSSLHRSLEADETWEILSMVFADRERFQVHRALPGGFAMRDEGAANQMRLRGGIEIFVHAINDADNRFLARQSADASRAVARLHQLDLAKTHFLRQHPAAVAAGAFHNDVVATSCGNVMLYHELAFYEADESLHRLRSCYLEVHGQPPYLLMVPSEQVSLADAVASYLFNSQLICARRGGLMMICPAQCREMESVRLTIERLLAGDNPIVSVEYVDLRESMWNGGGPACLRLRVAVSPADLGRIHSGVLWSERLADQLVQCIERYYPVELTADTFGDVNFANEARLAVAEVRRVLGLR